MDFDDIKIWIKANQKGLVVGAIAGFVVSRLLR